MKMSIEFAQKLSQAYTIAKKPLCTELGLPQTAFDILLFLYNNPDYTTARDVVEIRKLKANLVSVNISRLEQEGYLIRHETTGDRRKTQLILTDQGRRVAAQGQQLQKDFGEMLLRGVDEENLRVFVSALETIELNLNQFLKGSI